MLYVGATNAYNKKHGRDPVWSIQPSTQDLPCFVCLLSYRIVNNHFDNTCKVGCENPNPTPQPGPNPGTGTGAVSRTLFVTCYC